MYVLDTSSFIELIKETPKGKKICTILGDTPSIITTITVHEILAGVEGIQEKAVIKLLDGIELLNYDKDAAIKSAEIEKHLTKKGNKINKIDTLIAGICISQQKIIVTLDKHFKRIPGLKCMMV